MKRSAMKSNVSGEPRSRSDSGGRLFPRRKVASKSIVLNGTTGDFNFDKELSLAIQESLKYAAQQKEGEVKDSSIKSDFYPSAEVEESNIPIVAHNNNKRTSSTRSAGNSAINSMDPVEESTSVMSRNGNEWDSEEVARLKDLLLTQTELIECQQKELYRKDKEIYALMAGKDALQCRLERMERRMAILKNRDDILEDSPTTKTSDEDTKKPSPSEPLTTSVNKSRSSTTNWDLKRKKRRSRSQRLSHKKQHKYRKSEYVQSDVASDKEETGDEEDSIDTNSENEEEIQTESEHDSDKENIKSVDVSNSEIDGRVNYPIMQTDRLYHLYYPKHVFASLDTDTSQERLAAQLEVETPTWRLKSFTNMYQLEGTENITDEAYYKRHLKMEQDEKKRKRWDLQRLRELKAIEKSQRQKEDELRASPEEMDVETFLPSVQELWHIEVTESIPVMAFGQPVPYVSPAEFEVPWEVSSSLSSSSSRLKSCNSHSKRY